MVVVILCIVWYGVYIYTCKCACVCVYVHVLCGARGGSGGAVVVVSAVYMCMHIYVAAACRSVLLIKLRQSSKLMLQGLIVAKVQSDTIASCQGMHLITKLQ